MKLSFVPLLVLGLVSCMDTKDQPKPQQFPNAEYSGNVSSLYEIGAQTSGSQEVDFKWRDSTGAVHALSEFKGKKVLLNFWAAWCSACTSEMPILNTIQDDERSSVKVIGVSIDNTSHSFATVLDYARQNHVGYQLVVDSTASLLLNYMALSSGTYAIPQTFVIGSDGQIKYLLQGGQTRKTFDDYLRSIQ